MRKIIKIALIFILIAELMPLDAGAVCLRVPVGANRERLNEGKFFVTDISRRVALREAVDQDIGDFFMRLDLYLHNGEKHSKKFDLMTDKIFVYADKIYRTLEGSGNLGWESRFVNILKEFMDYFSEDVLMALGSELDEEHADKLKKKGERLKLFYKSFTGADAIKDIDIEKLFSIAKQSEIHSYVTFNFKSQGEAKHVIGREGELYRAFLYLVRNLAESMQRKKDRIPGLKKFDFKGCVDVNVYSDKGFSVTEITDNGTGMPEEALEAFKNRTVWSSKGDMGGRGLKAARDIIERNGGTIDIRSEAGKGTTIIVKLPVSQKLEDLGKLTREVAESI